MAGYDDDEDLDALDDNPTTVRAQIESSTKIAGDAPAETGDDDVAKSSAMKGEPRRARRTWTKEEKRKILDEYDDSGEDIAVLNREGITTHAIKVWRESLRGEQPKADQDEAPPAPKGRRKSAAMMAPVREYVTDPNILPEKDDDVDIDSAGDDGSVGALAIRLASIASPSNNGSVAETYRKICQVRRDLHTQVRTPLEVVKFIGAVSRLVPGGDELVPFLLAEMTSRELADTVDA